MKILLSLGIAIILFISCNDKKESPKKTYDFQNDIQADTAVAVPVSKVKEKKIYPDFKAILDFPKIKDSTAFMEELKKHYGFDQVGCYKYAVQKYKKVKLYGSDADFVMIETDCDFNNVKYQLAIFTDQGKYVKTLYTNRYELVKIFPNKNPFLMNLEVTNAGNGAHEFFKITNDTLESLNTLYEDFPNTYDNHNDNGIFEPEELQMSFKDVNKDGYNDIVFKGIRVLTQYRTPQGDWVDGITQNGKTESYSIDHPFKKVPIKMVLLYDKKTKRFVPKENYSEKYKEYYY